MFFKVPNWLVSKKEICMIFLVSIYITKRDQKHLPELMVMEHSIMNICDDKGQREQNFKESLLYYMINKIIPMLFVDEYHDCT